MHDANDPMDDALARALEAMDASPSDAIDGPDASLAGAEERMARHFVRELRSALPLPEPARFRTGFAERVTRRLTQSRSLRFGLERQFRRLVPLAAAAILALGLANVLSGRTRGATLLEAMLGLPPITVDATLFEADVSSVMILDPEAAP